MPSKQSTTRSGRVSKSTPPAYPRRSSSTTHEGPIARALRRQKSAQAASKSLARTQPRMDPPRDTPPTTLAPTANTGLPSSSQPAGGTQPLATTPTASVDEKPDITQTPSPALVTPASTLHAPPPPAPSAPLDYFHPPLPLRTTPTLAASVPMPPPLHTWPTPASSAPGFSPTSPHSYSITQPLLPVTVPSLFNASPRILPPLASYSFPVTQPFLAVPVPTLDSPSPILPALATVPCLDAIPDIQTNLAELTAEIESLRLAESGWSCRPPPHPSSSTKEYSQREPEVWPQFPDTAQDLRNYLAYAGRYKHLFPEFRRRSRPLRQLLRYMRSRRTTKLPTFTKDEMEAIKYLTPSTSGLLHANIVIPTAIRWPQSSHRHRRYLASVRKYEKLRHRYPRGSSLDSHASSSGFGRTNRRRNSDLSFHEWPDDSDRFTYRRYSQAAGTKKKSQAHKKDALTVIPTVCHEYPAERTPRTIPDLFLGFPSGQAPSVAKNCRESEENELKPLPVSDPVSSVAPCRGIRLAPAQPPVMAITSVMSRCLILLLLGFFLISSTVSSHKTVLLSPKWSRLPAVGISKDSRNSNVAVNYKAFTQLPLHSKESSGAATVGNLQWFPDTVSFVRSVHPQDETVAIKVPKRPLNGFHGMELSIIYLQADHPRERPPSEPPDTDMPVE